MADATAASGRGLLITGNWKMNLMRAEASGLAGSVVQELGTRRPGSGVQVALAPPFTAIDVVRDAIRGSRLLLAAQDVGAAGYTGEVSAVMLADAGVELVIVGHSERRHGLGESDETVLDKVLQACRAGLQVTLCVGETGEERDAGRAQAVVEQQVAAVVSRVELGPMTLQIAYEPVWAIGTGRTATPDDARSMHAHIRAIVATFAGSEAAEALIIQYGGSVKPGNAAALLAQDGVDGLLVGGASLEATSFAGVVPV